MSTILVTDDEKGSRDSIRMVLEREGHEVEAVESVDGALQRLGARQFDLIFCDYRMPGKTGIDLLKELAERRCTVPVIIVTAYAGGNIEFAARAIGATAVLRKPVRRRDLIDCATRAIEG